MNVFGIFNKLENYKLLRFSNAPQETRIYQTTISENHIVVDVEEVCFPDIENNVQNIGKFYNPDTKEFYV